MKFIYILPRFPAINYCETYPDSHRHYVPVQNYKNSFLTSCSTVSIFNSCKWAVRRAFRNCVRFFFLCDCIRYRHAKWHPSTKICYGWTWCFKPWKHNTKGIREKIARYIAWFYSNIEYLQKIDYVLLRFWF